MIGILFVVLVSMCDFVLYVFILMKVVGRMVFFDLNLRFIFWKL